MKVSIITPEHDPANASGFLLELFESIRGQTHPDWEWVLYLNGRATRECIPESIRIHPNVRIHVAQDPTDARIGHIKRHAFSLGSGDLLLEADHDDLLSVDCLARVVEAFQADEDTGFVYSDSAVLHMTAEFVPFTPETGWTYREIEAVLGTSGKKKLVAMNSFEPSSQSLAFIWYAPDHVRCWRKEVYDAVGGHDPTLDVCDDHDLLVRTYLKTGFKRIPEVLYIYRITGENSWLRRSQTIQQTTVELFHKHARALAERDAELRGLRKIDLGGGLFPRPGYTVLDKRESADVVCDLDAGIPLESDTVGVVNASHILEHLKDPIASMKEIYRVCAHGAWVFIEVPSTDGRGAFQDPTHVSFWNENSFLYYCNREYAKFIDTPVRFMPFRVDTAWQDPHIAVTRAWLVAVKEGGSRLPHKLLI